MLVLGGRAGRQWAVWVAASSQVENRRVQWARLVLPRQCQWRSAVAGRTMLGSRLGALDAASQSGGGSIMSVCMCVCMFVCIVCTHICISMNTTSLGSM